MNNPPNNIIHYDHSDLNFEHLDILYTMDFEGREYWIVGFMGYDDEDYRWTVQYDPENEDGQLELLTDLELSNRILIHFFNILEEAVTESVEEAVNVSADDEGHISNGE